jgi:hypothetical protein
MPLSVLEFAQAYVPLTLLYEHMTDETPLRTALANGQEYSSCIVRSSMLEETAWIVVPSWFVEGLRWVSCSLPM